MSSNEVVKRPPLELDSIDSFDDIIVGGADNRSQGGGFLPEGVQIKYTLTERWETKPGADITGKVVLHLDTLRTQVRWGKNGNPVGPPHILGPGEQYQDTEALNEAIPKEEWVPGFDGKMRGPLQNQNVVVFGDLATMERYVWPSPVTTIGSAICVRELTEKVQRMRQFRGGRVFAKIGFTKCIFPTRYGERQRPHLQILGWVEPTDDGLMQIDPRLLAEPQPALAPKMQPDPAPGARVVSEPSLREEMGDEIKF